MSGFTQQRTILSGPSLSCPNVLFFFFCLAPFQVCQGFHLIQCLVSGKNTSVTKTPLCLSSIIPSWIVQKHGTFSDTQAGRPECNWLPFTVFPQVGPVGFTVACQWYFDMIYCNSLLNQMMPNSPGFQSIDFCSPTIQTDWQTVPYFVDLQPLAYRCDQGILKTQAQEQTRANAWNKRLFIHTGGSNGVSKKALMQAILKEKQEVSKQKPKTLWLDCTVTERE